jgi:hypothetical protein
VAGAGRGQKASAARNNEEKSPGAHNVHLKSKILDGPSRFSTKLILNFIRLFPRGITVNNGAGLFALQMNFIELQLHYLNCGALLELQRNCRCIAIELRLHCNVSFCITAKETLKFQILTDVKTTYLIKKSPTEVFYFYRRSAVFYVSLANKNFLYRNILKIIKIISVQFRPNEL